MLSGCSSELRDRRLWILLHVPWRELDGARETEWAAVAGLFRPPIFTPVFQTITALSLDHPSRVLGWRMGSRGVVRPVAGGCTALALGLGCCSCRRRAVCARSESSICSHVLVLIPSSKAAGRLGERGCRLDHADWEGQACGVWTGIVSSACQAGEVAPRPWPSASLERSRLFRRRV